MLARHCFIVTFLILVCPLLARGQAFFTPGVTSYTPEIGVVNTGIVSDLSATVSADRKYVTLGARAQDAKLLSIQEFRLNSPQATGFAGGVQFTATAVASGEFGAVNPPVELISGRGTAILQQRGMTRIFVRK